MTSSQGDPIEFSSTFSELFLIPNILMGKARQFVLGGGRLICTKVLYLLINLHGLINKPVAPSIQENLYILCCQKL